jgi:predicted GIY-YIG superfamily endonuclease
MEQVEEIIMYIALNHYGEYYTGITNNLIRRWKEHNTLGKTWLSNNSPKEIIHVEWFGSRVAAAYYERKVKSIGAKKYLLMKKYKA